MGANSKIEWTWQRVNATALTLAQIQLALDIGSVAIGPTSDVILVPGYTFNPWIGCTKVSPGCANCYAAQQDAFRKWTPQGWGKGKPRKHTSAANWAKVKAWDAIAAKLGVRQRVFCASLADWLDDEVPAEWLTELLALIHSTPHLDWLLLTKRPENFRSRINNARPWFLDDMPLHEFLLGWVNGHAPANVWVGTTVEDQQRADERIPHLISIPAVVRFLSCEPLLESVDLNLLRNAPGRITRDYRQTREFIHWVIVGGESGPGSRPMHPDWARSLRDQCDIAKVPMLFKQWGDWCPARHGKGREMLVDGPHGEFVAQNEIRAVEHNDDYTYMARVSKNVAGRLLDGVEHNGSPVIGGAS